MGENNWPKVSVVIPVYNGSDYVGEAIDSALKQDYPNFEVLVVNDGSTDMGKTERVIKTFRKRVRYIKKPNGGVASALNLGIENMEGEWFSWLSHDDIYPTDRLRKLIKVWQKDKKVMFIYGQLMNIDKSGKPHPVMTEVYDFVADEKTPLVRQMLTNNLISGCTTLIHRDVFKKVGRFNEANRTAQDYDMWLRIAADFPMMRCPEIVIKRRVHNKMGTITLRPQVKIDTKLAVTEAIEKIPISTIYSDLLVNDSPKAALAYCYLQLGNLIVRRWHWFDVARWCYEKAAEVSGDMGIQIICLLGPMIGNSPTLVRQQLREWYWNIRRVLENQNNEAKN